MPHSLRDRGGYQEQRWSPSNKPNIIIRKPSAILGTVSPPTSPRSAPKGTSLSFPRLAAREGERDNGESALSRRDTSEDGVAEERWLRRIEALESRGSSVGDHSLLLHSEESATTHSASVSSCSVSSSEYHDATTSTLATSDSSLARSDGHMSIDDLSDLGRRSGSEGSTQERLEAGLDSSHHHVPTRLRPRVDTQLPPTISTLPSSHSGHQRRGSSADPRFYTSPSYHPLSTPLHLTLETGNLVPPSPPPFADFANADPKTPTARSPPSSFVRPSIGERSKSQGSVVGKLKKKASISFRSALGGVKNEGEDGLRGGPADVDTNVRPATSARMAANLSSPRSVTSGRSTSSARARPSLHSLDFSYPSPRTPLTPLESAAYAPWTGDSNSLVQGEVSAVGAPSKSRRRANTSHGESRGFLSNLLKLKKSTATLRGDKSPSPRTPPPPLPVDLPITSIRPRSSSRRERSDNSTSSTSAFKGAHPSVLHIARQRDERLSAGESSGETRASSRSRRQDPSTDSLPLSSSPASGSYLGHSSSDGLASPRPSFSERRRAASSTRSATSTRSYHTFSDHGHGAVVQEQDQLPTRREERGEGLPGGRIAEFGELVRSLPKSSKASNASSNNTINTMSTVDSRSPFPTALSPPPRRSPRPRPSPSSSPNSATSPAVPSPSSELGVKLSLATPGRPPRDPRRPSSPYELARAASMVDSSSSSPCPSSPSSAV